LALACRLTLAVLGGASWPAAQAQPARVQYDISAGPLAQVLSRYAAQSGVALSLVAGQVAGQQSAGLHGRYEVDEGFAQLLRDTGLAARRGVSGYVLVAVPGEAAGSVVLPPVEVDADALPEKAVYTAPRSSAYLSSQDLDRFGRVSVGDLLAGIPGVQVGDSRNGGALDVNIRGIQGQSRVAVRVDGSEQALDVYRGYAGTQQRSYIDPDLLSSVTINKGPSMTSGAIGGSVEMRTIGVQDILVDGRHVGLRLTGDVWNNGVAAPHRTGKWNEDLRTLPHDDRGSLFGSDAKAGSAAFAYANAHLDVVAAYARRKQGIGRRRQGPGSLSDLHPRAGSLHRGHDLQPWRRSAEFLGRDRIHVAEGDDPAGRGPHAGAGLSPLRRQDRRDHAVGHLSFRHGGDQAVSAGPYRD